LHRHLFFFFLTTPRRGVESLTAFGTEEKEVPYAITGVDLDHPFVVFFYLLFKTNMRCYLDVENSELGAEMVSLVNLTSSGTKVYFNTARKEIKFYKSVFIS
jgi:hypothetical protein